MRDRLLIMCMPLLRGHTQAHCKATISNYLDAHENHPDVSADALRPGSGP